MEANFDGLIGPTHLFGGLSHGNLASTEHKGWISHPQNAALEGLEKMWRLASLGIPQGVIPPHERPHLPTLHACGFKGTPAEILTRAAHEEASLLLACSSASSMWMANSATVLPSSDTADSRLHFTAASLRTTFHRSIEAPAHYAFLRRIFANPTLFAHHHPLLIPDEGSANHIRFCSSYDKAGIHLFVFGSQMSGRKKFESKLFPARQWREASAAVARRGGLDPERVIFAQQEASTVDAGAFHNDLVSFGNQTLLICHEKAFLHTQQIIDEIQTKASMAGIGPIDVILITEKELPLELLLQTYLCNSQLVTNRTGQMILIAPQECRSSKKVVEWIQKRLIGGANPISEVLYVPLHESMHNGGGPACLRLAVPLTDEEQKAVHPGIWLTEELYHKLKELIREHYRPRLHYQDLGDPAFYEEVQAALVAISDALALPKLYSFQA